MIRQGGFAMICRLFSRNSSASTLNTLEFWPSGIRLGQPCQWLKDEPLQFTFRLTAQLKQRDQAPAALLED